MLVKNIMDTETILLKDDKLIVEILYPYPVFLPGESLRTGSLVGHAPGHTGHLTIFTSGSSEKKVAAVIHLILC